MSRIKALFIFEIMGRPPEHIVESLNDLVGKLGEQKGVEIVRKEVREAKKVEEENSDMYTSFAEVELYADDFNLISLIVLNMLPAHVEILEPAEYVFKNFELSTLLTDITVKVHKYDEMAKVMMMEHQNLLSKLKETEDKVREYDKDFEGVVKMREENVSEKDVEISKNNDDEKNEGDVGSDGAGEREDESNELEDDKKDIKDDKTKKDKEK